MRFAARLHALYMCACQIEDHDLLNALKSSPSQKKKCVSAGLPAYLTAYGVAP